MLNFGILGAGNIARTMARALSGLRREGIRPYAVAARDAKRAEDFAHTYGFEKSYGSYEELIANPLVDIVYVAVIHPVHAQLVRAALDAGKHVLCEKPMTLNRSEAAALFALAESKGLLLQEATWTRFLPFAGALRTVLAEPALGPVCFVQAEICETVAENPRIALPQLGGGALLDIGIYALTQLCMAVPGDAECTGTSCIKNEHGADLAESISLCFAGGVPAAACIDVRVRTPYHRAVFCCKNGTVQVEGPLWCPSGMTVCIGGREQHFDFSDCPKLPGGGFEYEVRSCVKAVEAGLFECPEHPHSETLRMLGIMDELRRRWNYTYPGETL